MLFDSHEEKQPTAPANEARSRSRAASRDATRASDETQRIALGNLALIERTRPWAQSGATPPCDWHVSKRLRREHLSNAQCRTLFVNSARALLGVHLPHLLRVLDVQQEPEPVVTLEFVEGASLAQCLRVSAPEESVRYVAPVLVDVLEALQALHTYRPNKDMAGSMFVHGAPVARHILLGFDGSVRLADCSHMVGPELPWSELHEQRLRPEEMAPEQALAPGHVDPRCDVFVAGIVLWQALTGTALFGSGERAATLPRMLRQLIELPSETGVRFDSGLDQVCLRALQRIRTERYASAAEFAHALRSEATRRGNYASREEIGAWVARCHESELRAPRSTEWVRAPAEAASSEPQAARSRRGAAARKSRALAQAELQAAPARQRDIAHTTLTGWPVMLPPNAAGAPRSVPTPRSGEGARSRAELRSPRYNEAQPSLIPEQQRGRSLQPLAGVLVAAVALLILFSVSDDRGAPLARERTPSTLDVADSNAGASSPAPPRPPEPLRRASSASAPQASPLEPAPLRDEQPRPQIASRPRTRPTQRVRIPLEEPERAGYAANMESPSQSELPPAAPRFDDLTIPNNPY